ncbi:divalent-cation tolerance protein CutA [candidate division KSB1 bacterium]|nr:divalent-cation tolerance protein CutA [candidate division KSB1 bacterium]RQW02709.1 MAG: divalent-cation tolerance protein CutA [candidate division KSB1 bacterium]
METIVVFITCPSKEEAEELATKILQEHLAACINILSGVHSLFHWQGKIERATEYMLLCKSRKRLLEELIQFVQLHHSYETPEIIALPIVGGSKEYLDWIKEETEPAWR